jgi:CBS-domain-containing membrane protein
MAATYQKPGLGRVGELTVGQVMCREITVIPASATMHTAACILADHSASGAPVVEDSGVCVGVLTANDFLTFEIDRTGDVVTAHSREVNAPQKGQYVPWNSVRKFMATAVQTVEPDVSLVQASEIMCAEHIHRLFILNKRGVPVGVITTLDVAAAFMNAAKEHAGVCCDRRERSVV